MLEVTSLTVDIGGRRLLDDASFVAMGPDKVGLVGRNGTGKSTLISVLLGTPASVVRTSGTVKVTGTLGFLPQMPVPGGLGNERSAFSHILSGRGLDVLDEALVAARRAMEQAPTDAHIEAFTDLEARYRASGGYEVESVLARMADGLGLRQDALFSDVDELSGGQRRRVDLMRVLFERPETLVLDEPTNHLDGPAKRWLMGELEAFAGTLLIVSHDLKLLDRAITKVLHLAHHTITEYKGTYSDFRHQQAAAQARAERAAELEGREVKRLSTLADAMRHGTERRARTAKALDRRVERLQANRTVVARRERATRFRLPTPARSGASPLEVEGLTVAYDGAVVIDGLRFGLGRGERLAVVGRNGAGKSSLLRCLAGVQSPTKGSVVLGHNVTLGYFAQEHEQIDPTRRVLDNIDDRVVPLDADRRALLGAFGLTGALADEMPPALSGGERAKLSLAMLAAGHANLLVLDEPTNNLDPAAVEAVGQMLGHWPGTIVAVSHERAFVAALQPTHALHLPGGRFTHWRPEYLDEIEER